MNILHETRSGPTGAGPSLAEGGERSREGATRHREAMSKATTSGALHAQSGAALLTAMIIVALVATLAGSMVWQQWRAVQVEAAERARTQSAWILAGALDWAQLILREDAKSGALDHLGEPWAVPLAEARLSTFLAADKDNTDDAPDAFLSGVISDMQARYNLTNVASGDKAELAALARLCDNVGVSTDVAKQIATGLRDAMPAPAPASAVSGAAGSVSVAPVTADLTATPASADPPLLPRSVRQLTWLGIDPETVQRLEPYVTILPERTPVNVNTATSEVLRAATGMDPAFADRIAQSRQRKAMSSADELALPPPLAASAASMSVGSNYFEVRGRLRLGDVVLEQRSLVQRLPGNPPRVIVLQRERVASREPGGS
jgi:general secretion pathway protein K